MPWVKLDDRFPENPKLAAVGPLGLALWVAGIAYCNRALTDGFIPRGIARTLIDWSWMDDDGVEWQIGITSGHAGHDVTAQMVVDLLVEHGLFDYVAGGVQVHDYLEFQPSRQEVLVQRERERGKKRKQRLSREDSPEESLGDSPGDTERDTPGSPAAPVPVPVPQELISTPNGVSSQKTEDDPFDEQAIQTVYREWRTLFGRTHGRYNTITPARRLKIKARLKEFSVTDLQAALRHAAADDWPDRAKHSDILVLFRSREKVEHWLDSATKNGHNPAAVIDAQLARAAEREAAARERWEAK